MSDVMPGLLTKSAPFTIRLDHSLPKISGPGSLHLEWTTCGKQTSRCARGLLHGPYVYLRWCEGSKQRKVYVPARELQRVMAEIEAKRALSPKPTEMKRMLKELRRVQ